MSKFGKRRHKIRIEVPVKVKSTTGAENVTWNLYREVYASIETLRGYERQVSLASWPTADVKMDMNFIAGILLTMRVVFENKIYSILNVNDLDERHRDIVLTTQQGVKAQ